MRLEGGGYLSAEGEGLRLAAGYYGVRDRERTNGEAGKGMKVKPRKDSCGQHKGGLQPRAEAAIQRVREGVVEPFRNPGEQRESVGEEQCAIGKRAAGKGSSSQWGWADRC